MIDGNHREGNNCWRCNHVVSYVLIPYEDLEYVCNRKKCCIFPITSGLELGDQLLSIQNEQSSNYNEGIDDAETYQDDNIHPLVKWVEEHKTYETKTCDFFEPKDK